jgi:hypothetical protein
MRESCRPRQYHSRAFRSGIALGRPPLSEKAAREQALEGSGELEIAEQTAGKSRFIAPRLQNVRDLRTGARSVA